MPSYTKMRISELPLWKSHESYPSRASTGLTPISRIALSTNPPSGESSRSSKTPSGSLSPHEGQNSSSSQINLLPKKEVENVLDYMLSEDFGPYKLGIEGRQIYIAYRIHLADITDESEDEIRKNIVGLALRADEMDNMLVERFGCEFSEYSKTDAES